MTAIPTPKKKSGKNSEPAPSDLRPAKGNVGGVLVPQPGGGYLVRGGRNANAGRRPSAIRKKALRMLASRLPLVGHIADGVAIALDDDGGHKLVSPRANERLQAIKLLADLGMGETVSVSELRHRLRAQLELIRSQETWSQAELITALGAVWQ